MTVDREFVRGLLEDVSHHLRTPLTVVLGHAELLVDRQPALPEDVGRSLRAVLRAAQRLDDVVGGVCDLMDVACVAPTDVGLLDLSALVADEVGRHRDRAAARGIRLRTSSEGPPRRQVADPRRLRRALRELLDNALTYAPDGSVVSITSTTSETGFRFTVSDEGAGIDVDDRARLGRAFERGAPDPLQPCGGAGTGLALASAVAIWHGGRLTLSQAPGCGLRASIEIPGTWTHPSRPSPLGTRSPRTDPRTAPPEESHGSGLTRAARHDDLLAVSAPGGGPS